MHRYLLIEEFTCPECDGSGWVQHPAWEQYWAENGPPPGLPTREADDAWFRQQGYEDSNVPEEIPCIECEGAGSIRRESELREALQALADCA